jgi:hypothetical protein
MTGAAAQPRPGEFASLIAARAFIGTLRDRISSFDPAELLEVLQQLDRAYQEFPELLVDRTRKELLEALRSAAESLPDHAAVPILAYCVASDPSDASSLTSLLKKIAAAEGWPELRPILPSLCRSRAIEWPGIRSILDAMAQQGRTDAALSIISEVLDCLKFPDGDGAADLGDILASLLRDGQRETIDSRALAETARAAQRRLRNGSFSRDRSSTGREILLAMAERLRVNRRPARSKWDAEFAWPSGRLSFGEFLLQWPCEIELPAEPDDMAFIDEAYRAILLRAPHRAETDQYLRLLRDGVISRIWLIEDLLASRELRSLDRRLRVSCDGRVITEPGSSGDLEMPAVKWPPRADADDRSRRTS